MDLKTNYLGFDLAHPFLPGASPLCDDLDTVRRLEDAGAPALVLRSLFEEQIVREQVATFVHTESHGESFAEAMTYFPAPQSFVLGPDEYLDHLRQVKRAVSIPVIASLNGTTPGAWIDHGKLLEEAGADAIELNVYRLATDLETDGRAVEEATLTMVRDLRAAVTLPLAVKLSPFYSAPASFGAQCARAGASALVLFNRFYQPDVDPVALEVKRELHLSTSEELPLRLRWLAILSGRVAADLAVSGGVHTAVDGVKSIMCGASAVQVVSALLKHGPDHLKELRVSFERWLEEHEWNSVSEMRGNLGLDRCPDPAVYERANYMLMLQSWKA